MSRPSLETYIQKKYYNLLFSKARAFLIEHREEIDLSTRNIRNPRKLIDIDVYAIYTSMLDNNRLEMEIVVTAFVEVSERYKGELEVDEKTIWLSMVTEVVLDNGIQSFVVQSVDLKEQNRRCSRFLSRSGVPYIKKTDFDELANAFLAKYYPQALKSPTKIDVTELAAAMGLTVIETKLSSDFSIFGKMVFKDTEIETYDANNQAIRRLIKKGTICADEEVSQKRNIGSLNNTIIHECVHWEFHRIYHELRMLVDETHDSVSCRTQENLSDVANWTDLDWMEWQANNLAPKILMPKKQTRQKIEDFYRALSSIYSDLSKIEVTTEVVDSLANFFQVSRQSAKIRLVELGFREAKGILEYIDGAYLPLFAFGDTELKNNQTFSISLAELERLVEEDESFAKVLRSGLYVYIESHLVMNLPQFVTKDAMGNLVLTEEARYHLDECALLFEYHRADGVKKEITYQDFVLNRSQFSNISFELVYHNGYENSTKEKQEQALLKQLEEEDAIYNKLSNDFEASMQVVKKWRQVTYKEIGEELYFSEKQISRLFKGDGSLELFILICVYLNLPPSISMHLLEKSKWKLDPGNIPHRRYQLVLHTLHSQSVGQVKEFLEKVGVTI